jgi:hypothetical protein
MTPTPNSQVIMEGEQRRSNDDDKQTQQSRCSLLEETQPDTETQQQPNNTNDNVVVDAAAEEKKKATAVKNADDDDYKADIIDLEAAFPPELNRVSRTPGAFREGGDNSSPNRDQDYDDNDDAVINSTGRTRRMMHRQTGASPDLGPVTETLVSATLVTVPTAVAAVYGVPLPGSGEHSLPSPPESLRSSGSLDRKKRLVRTAGFVGVLALVVGLSLALVFSGKNSSKDPAPYVHQESSDTLVNATTTTVLVNDANGVAMDVPEQDVANSPALSRQIQYAVTWGTASDCEEIMGNGVTLQLQCGGTGSQDLGLDTETDTDTGIDIELQLVVATNAVCQRQTATEMTCQLDTSESLDLALDQWEQAPAAVVFTCTAGLSESLAAQLLQLQAVAVVSETMASQCATVLQQGALNATTGQQTTFYGGKTVSYASLGRYCRRDSVTEQESTLRVVTSNWQVEAELFTCQGQSRPIAATDSTDGNGSSLQQDYCYDAATCTVESTCVHVADSSDDGDEVDIEIEIEIEDDESSGSSGSSGSGSGTAQTTVQDPVCVGSTQCTSLLESVVLTAPEGSSRCATVVGQQEDVLSVEQLSAMSQSELVETLDLFLQQFV